MRHLLHITGLLVSAAADQAQAVHARLQQMSGVEVHAMGSAGRLVVTVEADSDAGLCALLEEVNSMAGVCSTVLVYHHAENVKDLA